MNLKIHFNHFKYADRDLSVSILEILEENKLCSMATIKEGNHSYINTAYFCYNKYLEFYILSDPKTQHCLNLEENNSVALAIYDSHQAWSNDLKGLQIIGKCALATGEKLIEGTALYLKRFADLGEWIKHPDDFAKGVINSRPYIIKTNWLKLFDEDRFGEENFITLSY